MDLHLLGYYSCLAQTVCTRLFHLRPYTRVREWGWGTAHPVIDPLYYSHTSHTPHMERNRSGHITTELMSCHQEMQWWCSVARDTCQLHCDVFMTTDRNGTNSGWSNCVAFWHGDNSITGSLHNKTKIAQPYCQSQCLLQKIVTCFLYVGTCVTKINLIVRTFLNCWIGSFWES